MSLSKPPAVILKVDPHDTKTRLGKPFLEGFSKSPSGPPSPNKQGTRRIRCCPLEGGPPFLLRCRPHGGPAVGILRDPWQYQLDVVVGNHGRIPSCYGEKPPSEIFASGGVQHGGPGGVSVTRRSHCILASSGDRVSVKRAMRGRPRVPNNRGLQLYPVVARRFPSRK